jgi:AmiR/NasT family two-component response regulator
VQIAHIEIVLRTARTIGVAMGIIVERHKVSECEAFHALADVSQRSNRKLRDIAADLVYTGELPDCATQDQCHRAAD